MAEVTATDPFRGFKFSVTVNGGVGPYKGEVGFQKVSGLKEATEVAEYREGNMSITKRKLPGLTTYDPITMTRGLAFDSLLLEWRALVARYGNAGGYADGIPAANQAQGVALSAGNNGFRREVDIALFDKGDRNEKPAYTWKVHMSWPSELSVNDLNAEASEVLVESMVLQHEGFEPGLVQGPGKN